MQQQTFITDEGSQRLPKCLQIVDLLASVDNLNHDNTIDLYSHFKVSSLVSTLQTATTQHVIEQWNILVPLVNSDGTQHACETAQFHTVIT